MIIESKGSIVLDSASDVGLKVRELIKTRELLPAQE
jgi:hypothetical protein